MAAVWVAARRRNAGGLDRGRAAGGFQLAFGNDVVVADQENEGNSSWRPSSSRRNRWRLGVRHMTGAVCAPMRRSGPANLGIPHMVGRDTDVHGPAFAVSVNAASTGGGVGANRCATAQALATTGPGLEHLVLAMGDVSAVGHSARSFACIRKCLRG
ncbi:3,4-dihydroxy-2-butanone-4-phosphate synthase [Nocardia xishanensis]|uniref:3,4-dihydroxy-2-butanone-4-phosphate synthase n=1 Tax=Nocardia xishanensis TaxID=238964 RepID=A0ABW7XC63_9NOCA